MKNQRARDLSILTSASVRLDLAVEQTQSAFNTLTDDRLPDTSRFIRARLQDALMSLREAQRLMTPALLPLTQEAYGGGGPLISQSESEVLDGQIRAILKGLEECIADGQTGLTSWKVNLQAAKDDTGKVHALLSDMLLQVSHTRTLRPTLTLVRKLLLQLGGSNS